MILFAELCVTLTPCCVKFVLFLVSLCDNTPRVNFNTQVFAVYKQYDIVISCDKIFVIASDVFV